MTSKEFLRRFEAYSALNTAAICFNTPLVDFIYRVVIVDNSHRKIESYCTSPNLFSDIRMDNCMYIMFERFDRIDMRTQIRYFNSFFNRCSSRQKDILIKSPSLSSLFDYDPSLVSYRDNSK